MSQDILNDDENDDDADDDVNNKEVINWDK